VTTGTGHEPRNPQDEPSNDSRIAERDPRAAASAASDPSTTVIPVAQEDLDVRKHRVETDAGVRVHMTVQEREAVVNQALERDEVCVERVRVGRPVSAPPKVRYDGDTMIIPVLEEVLVVEKRLMLQEEVHVTRRRRAVHAPRRVTLRSEQAHVERIEPHAGVHTPHRSDLESDGASPGAAPAPEDDSLIEHKRRHTDLLRGRLASELPDEHR
jgi:uncharacterized protein (TIGR02271 family)